MITAPQEQDTTNVNSPAMDESGKVTRKAISSSEQAYGIASKLELDNKERNELNAIILKKYNGGQPYVPSDLKANSEDWRSNAPTGFMSSIVDRITPSPMQAIDGARYLTSATLDDASPEAEKKSEYFRQEVTKAIRRWDGWRDFLSSMWQELILMGYASPLNLNPYSPWPKMFKGDEVFYPEGTGQHANTIPVLAAKEDLLLHEFANAFVDGKEVSEGAHWHFDNCIKVINEALPKTTTDKEGDARKWEDAIREANAGASHAGAKVVKLYHTIAVETDTQKVTHYIVNRDGNHEVLLSQEERFDRIDDVATLMTLQPANGKYYASKGIGRLLLNLHISIERARNGMLDNLYLSGIKIIQVPANQTPSFQQRMAGPFMIVSSEGTFDQHGIQTTVEEFLKADDQISRWSEQLVGSYISGLHGEEGPSKTAREVTVEANRDAQARSAFLSRGLGQLAYLISQITRRLCDPETTDKIAKELQEELKDPERGNLTQEEIDKLKNAPAADVVQDLTQMHNQQIVAIFPVLKGDPNINQKPLYERFLAAAVNLQFAKDVFLTEQGLQANEAEAVRQQMGETEDILSGAPGIPVSPRDMHDLHLKTIFSDLKNGIQKIAQTAPQDPSILDHFNTQLVHSGAHIKMMKDQGAPPESVQPFEKAQKAFESILTNMAEGVKQSRMAPAAPPQAPEAQAAPEQPMNQPNGPLPITEKIATAWIGQYDKLPDAERRKLEQITGLGVFPPDNGGPAPVASEPVAPVPNQNISPPGQEIA